MSPLPLIRRSLTRLKHGGFRVFRRWNSGSRTRKAVLILAVLSVVSLMATYVQLVRSESVFVVDAREILALVILDLILLLSLAGLISKRLARLVAKRRKGIAGSRLQTRLVFTASLMAIIPTVIVSVSSMLFFNFGLQAWFDRKVSTAIESSVAIAKSYLEEHKKIIQADILGMANDLNREAYNIRKSPQTFNQKLEILAGVRKLPEAIVFQMNENTGTRRILAHTRFSVALEMILENLPLSLIDEAENGQLVTYTTETDERVIALVRLESYFDTYLLVARFVDDTILRHIEMTEGAADQYQRLRTDISQVEIQFYLVFLGGAMLLVLAAIWVGYLFAVQLVQPLSRLVEATGRVKDGDWQARVKLKGPDHDEMVILGRAFNEMAGQLEHQRQELISAQRRSAWADVARRIAHEIKNPLTPIHLAAERLRKKYAPMIDGNEKERNQFERYVTTITRNVGDIRRMADEFANFARLPAPVFAACDLASLLKDVVFSRKGCTEVPVEYITDIPDIPCLVECDESQVSRVLTNLLKNAEESIEEYVKEQGHAIKGVISTTLLQEEGQAIITITDNGKGFDEALLAHVTEPYVTTKEKGTGLGLAIVTKIVEDHKGKLSFANHPKKHGAVVSLRLPSKNI